MSEEFEESVAEKLAEIHEDTKEMCLLLERLLDVNRELSRIQDMTTSLLATLTRKVG